MSNIKITDSGICRVLDEYESGCISELIISKEAFIEAYKKYILNAEDEQREDA